MVIEDFLIDTQKSLCTVMKNSNGTVMVKS